MSKLTIELTEEQHRQIKVESARKGMSMKDFMLKQSLGEKYNPQKRRLGQWTGKVWMSDDFSEFGEELQKMFRMLPEKSKKRKK